MKAAPRFAGMGRIVGVLFAGYHHVKPKSPRCKSYAHSTCIDQRSINAHAPLPSVAVLITPQELKGDPCLNNKITITQHSFAFITVRPRFAWRQIRFV